MGRNRTSAPSRSRRAVRLATPLLPARRPSWGILPLAAGALILLLAAAPDAVLNDWLTRIDLDRAVRPPASMILLAARVAGALAGCTLLALGAWLIWRPRGQAAAAASARDARTFLDQLFLDPDPPKPGEARHSGWILALVILAGALLRSAFLTEPIGYDESTTVVYFASRSLLDIVSDYSIPNNQVLHTLLVHAAYWLGGADPALLRLPAFIAGLLIIPLTYLLARKLFSSDAVGVAAAVLIAVAPPMVEPSVTARGYTLMTVFFLVAFLAATALAERETRTGWIVFVGACALGFFTVPTMLLGVGIPLVWLLLAADPGRRRALAAHGVVALLCTGVLTTLLYAPVLARSGLASLLRNEYVVPLTTAEFFRDNLATAGELGGCWSGALPAPAGALLLATGFVPLALTGLSGRNARVLMLAVLLWVVPVIVVNRVAPPVRSLNFLFPIAAMLIAFGLHTAVRVWGHAGPRFWTVLVLSIGAIWGMARLARGDAAWSRPDQPTSYAMWGRNGTAFCAEGFFVDAPVVVERYTALQGARPLMVAYNFSGMVQPIQFYLLQHGRNPAEIRPYREARGLAQIADARDVLLVLPDSGVATGFADVLQLLSVDAREFARTYDPPTLVEDLAVSDVYRLHRRLPPDPRPLAVWDRISYPH